MVALQAAAMIGMGASELALASGRGRMIHVHHWIWVHRYGRLDVLETKMRWSRLEP